MSPASPPSTGRSVAELSEERDFLLRSIEDLEREHAAGDVDDADYVALRASYVERAAVTLRELATTAEGGGAGPAPAEPISAKVGRPGSFRRFRRFLGRRRTRRVLVVVGVVCMLGLVLVVASHAAGVRLPGESATGSVELSSAAQVRQELEQASILATEGQIEQAISTYDTILAQVPRQPEALAYKGWYIRLVGIADHSTTAVGDGDGLISEAVRAAPGYAEARAFYGVALLDDESNARGALAQFRAFLADHPPSALLSSVGGQAAGVFEEEHVAVPSALRKFESKASASAEG